jgi:tellurite resistance protein TerC
VELAAKSREIAMILFPFAEFWWVYAAITALIAAFLALDLGVFHRKAHAVGFREAGIWTVVWIVLALAFNFAFYRFAAWQLGDEVAARHSGLEFLTGYVVEKALSLDNIFVFVVIFGFFGIAPKFQHRVLFYGIAGALVFRAIFIAAGSALLQHHWVIVLFGGVLILTGVKTAFAPAGRSDPERNPLVRLIRRFLPVASDPEGQRFFLRRKGVLHATPLLLALAAIEVSDILFAIDSVPAIFALTREPLIVFGSNVFAILGLRSLYFLLASAVERFVYLKYGLGAVLVFVGLKMVWLNDAFDGKFPISWSLGIIAGLVATSILASLLLTERHYAPDPKLL